jgi:DNA-binding transcriptional ArsR family regulator
MPAADPRVQLLLELADETRFAVLERLETGPASATELAQMVGASPTQLANHLRRLRDAGLVRAHPRGRLAVYELAEPGLREIFSMLNGLRGRPRERAREVALATTCYDHLAGDLGVVLFEHLTDVGALRPREGEGELELGASAAADFAELGVALPAGRSRRMLAYACMDSLVGRPHLGGLLGARLAEALRGRGWVRDGEHRRELTLTSAGRRGLKRLGISTPSGQAPGRRSSP